LHLLESFARANLNVHSFRVKSRGEGLGREGEGLRCLLGPPAHSQGKICRSPVWLRINVDAGRESSEHAPSEERIQKRGRKKEFVTYIEIGGQRKHGHLGHRKNKPQLSRKRKKRTLSARESEISETRPVKECRGEEIYRSAETACLLKPTSQRTSINRIEERFRVGAKATKAASPSLSGEEGSNERGFSITSGACWTKRGDKDALVLSTNARRVRVNSPHERN